MQSVPHVDCTPDEGCGLEASILRREAASSILSELFASEMAGACFFPTEYGRGGFYEDYCNYNYGL